MKTMTGPQSASTSDLAWEAAPRFHPPLLDGVLHVWQVDLSRASDEVLGVLAADELARAAAFLDRPKSKLWARSRGLLRVLLGRYLEHPPQDLRFLAGEHGKPRLLDDGAYQPRRRSNDLSFNVSHSGELAVYAFTRIGPVGIDVERSRQGIDERRIAARLGLAGADRLAELEAPERQREFLRLWVRREAAIKQRGSQLHPSTIIPAPGLWIAGLDVGSDHAAAVAVERCPSELRCWSADFAGASTVRDAKPLAGARLRGDDAVGDASRAERARRVAEVVVQ